MGSAYSHQEILETVRMLNVQCLDIRTVTLGINLRPCADPDIGRMKQKIRDRILLLSKNLVPYANQLQSKYGITIVNKRIAVTPISLILGPAITENKEESVSRAVEIAETLDEAAKKAGVDFIGGFSALCYKDTSTEDRILMEAIPEALARTERVCASTVLASTRSGLNMDAVNLMATAVKRTAAITKDAIGCGRLVAFANAPEDNPFMAGAFCGIGEGDSSLNVGVSGPGVVKAALAESKGASLQEMSETIKKQAFKITRAGQLVGRELAKMLGVRFGIVDLSLAPTTAEGDSVAEIIEAMGVESCGAPGTTAALAMLVDAVKKGGAMGAESTGGLSGAFIPVSEDAGMLKALERGSLTIEKLEAMTSVCSVGMDMILVPGDTSEHTIAGIIADELMIGVMNNKTTAVRIIPVPGKKEGDLVDYGSLLGRSRIMKVSKFSSKDFVTRGGRIPAPQRSLTN